MAGIRTAASRRRRTYLLLRLAAGAAFVFAVTVLHGGPTAFVVVLVAGGVAVGASVAANAGARGEAAGARAQDRYFNRITAPQGQWPPYDPGSR